MGMEDDFLQNDVDDEKTIEYIKNYLPQELKEKFSDDEFYYFLDLIDEYYSESGILDAQPDDGQYATDQDRHAHPEHADLQDGRFGSQDEVVIEHLYRKCGQQHQIDDENRVVEQDHEFLSLVWQPPHDQVEADMRATDDAHADIQPDQRAQQHFADFQGP